MSDPKVVLFDLETIPDLDGALDVWPQLSNYPGQTLKASINSICCFGWKVLGDKEAQVKSAWDFPEWLENVNNDKPLITFAYEILKDADAIITQNGKSFDEKVIQTRFLLAGMDILPRIQHVDTKYLAKKFSFFSNSLKYLAEKLTTIRKIENEGWPLWKKVHGGSKVRVRNEEAERTMAEYCKGDVEALEAIHKRLRVMSGGANQLPNQNLFQIGGSKNLCPHCGSTRLKKNGFRHRQTASYQRYFCLDCRTPSLTDLKDRNPRSDR